MSDITVWCGGGVRRVPDGARLRANAEAAARTGVDVRRRVEPDPSGVVGAIEAR